MVQSVMMRREAEAEAAASEASMGLFRFLGPSIHSMPRLRDRLRCAFQQHNITKGGGGVLNAGQGDAEQPQRSLVILLVPSVPPLATCGARGKRKLQARSCNSQAPQFSSVWEHHREGERGGVGTFSGKSRKRGVGGGVPVRQDLLLNAVLHFSFQGCVCQEYHHVPGRPQERRLNSCIRTPVCRHLLPRLFHLVLMRGGGNRKGRPGRFDKSRNMETSDACRGGQGPGGTGWNGSNKCYPGRRRISSCLASSTPWLTMGGNGEGVGSIYPYRHHFRRSGDGYATRCLSVGEAPPPPNHTLPDNSTRNDETLSLWGRERAGKRRKKGGGIRCCLQIEDAPAPRERTAESRRESVFESAPFGTVCSADRIQPGRTASLRRRSTVLLGTGAGEAHVPTWF
ncbi:hypothetical protein LX32DRAFT_406391 [Colletotrichum zoysiae]|uniref:Uncharacterized protein n=1 Tax=Colletotrichum zoysiae TaxID=1216348 RepID=A0AAD9HFP1_9PEZI|nr:hypothetical protein LX32DRAFT_406391 [Colletotrichum zoysiae]